MTSSHLVQPEVRVLVVHSDPADLAVLASVVAAHEFELRVLESSERLVAEVVRYQPDAVVLDVKQRDTDGYGLCLSLKADPGTAGVAVILTGSLDGPEARHRAFAAGCDDFLEKPIHRQVLAHRLRSFARLRRAWLRDAPLQPLAVALRRFVTEVVAILRRDAGVVDPALVAAIERWLDESQEQPQQIEP